MVLLPSMHILTQFKNATSGEERQMVCQALLARHAQGGGMTVVAEQERRGGGKWGDATCWNDSFMLALSGREDFHMERKISSMSIEAFV